MFEANELRNGSTTGDTNMAIQDRIDSLMIEASSYIESFASGYDSSGFKATVDSFANTI